MKKRMIVFLSILFAIIFSITAFAEESEQFGIQDIDPDSLEEMQVISVGEESTPEGIVEIYTIAVPGDGQYYEVPDFCDEYDKGTIISVQGTWAPTYEDLTIMFRDVSNGGAVEVPNAACNSLHDFPLWNNSNWALMVRAQEKGVVGTIRVTIA